VPEGQVSHRNALRFTDALVGHEVVRVSAPEPRLAGQELARRLTGEVVTAAEAVGKHHLLRFASGRVLHSHLMMSGVWRLLPAGRPLRPGGLFLATLGASDLEGWQGEWLGVPMYFSGHDPATNRELLSAFELVDDEVVAISEPEGAVSFHWILARR
jgi:hypothetical protein